MLSVAPHLLPEAVFSAARAVVVELQDADAETLTHADLSLHNIMGAADGRCVAIDPYFTAGPAAHQGHTVIRSYPSEIVHSSDPAGLINRWTQEFSESAGADPASTHQISLARYVASYCWESQNAGDQTDVSNLREATRLAMELAS